MSWLWLIPAFVAGWMACSRTYRLLTRRGIRPEQFRQVLKRVDYSELTKMRQALDAEVARREQPK